MLAADGFASGSGNPACCFCGVWARRARGTGGRHVRAQWFGHAHLPKRGRCVVVWLRFTGMRSSCDQLGADDSFMYLLVCRRFWGGG